MSLHALLTGAAVAIGAVIACIAAGTVLYDDLFGGRTSGHAAWPYAGAAIGLVALALGVLAMAVWRTRRTQSARASRDRWLAIAASLLLTCGSVVEIALARALIDQDAQHIPSGAP
jgi:hypothetical protein